MSKIQNLFNATLDIVTIHRPPFSLLTMADDGKTILKADGYCFEIIRMLQEKFNFTYRLHLPYDGNWGSLMSNGSWNGMVGMVNRTEVDLAVSSITISALREEGGDFTLPFFEEPTGILLATPKSVTDLLAILNPFSWQVWMAIVLVFSASAGFLLFFENIFRQQIPKLYPHKPSVRVHLNETFWFLFGCLVYQGGCSMPANNSCRIIIAFWWFFATVLSASYTGTLVAYLTSPKLVQTINSLEELAAQGEVKWTYRRYTQHDILFSTSSAPLYRKIGSYRNLVNSDSHGLDRVLEGGWAFIKELSFLEFAVDEDFRHTGQCRLSVAKRRFFNANYGMILQTNSAYLQDINRELLNMFENGFFSKWKRKFWPEKILCGVTGRSVESTVRTMTVADFLSPLLLYAMGMCIASVVFVLEVFVKVLSRIIG